MMWLLSKVTEFLGLLTQTVDETADDMQRANRSLNKEVNNGEV